MKIIVKDNQTIYDIALQYAGSLEAVIDILEANGKANTTLLIGEELVIPYVLESKVAGFFSDKGLVVATSSTPMEVDGWVPPQPGVCLPSIIKNTNSTFSLTVPSGATEELPDEQYNIYVNGALKTTFIEPAMQDLLIKITL